ncbi:hypothetical protein GCM10027030_05810 [Luteococcus sediminum]|uniref:hypothetical protein n=1 Tax=Luteococcus sp. TaxID=1969402 RepID=UPI003735A499
MTSSIARHTATGLAGLALLASSIMATPQAPAAARPTTLPQPTTANLATAADLAPVARQDQPVGPATTRRATALPEDFSLCDEPKALGQRTLLVRDFARIDSSQVVLGFGTARQASAARARILEAYRNCVIDADTNSTIGSVDGTLPLERSAVKRLRAAPVRATAASASMRYTEREWGAFEDAAVVQTGNRLTWLVVHTEGQDNNCSLLADDETIGQCGAFASADALARRLARR